MRNLWCIIRVSRWLTYIALGVLGVMVTALGMHVSLAVIAIVLYLPVVENGLLVVLREPAINHEIKTALHAANMLLPDVVVVVAIASGVKLFGIA